MSANKRMTLYTGMVKDGLTKTYSEFLSTYFSNANGIEKLWQVLVSNGDYDDNIDIFYQKFACDLPWAKKTQYCITNKYSNDWSKYPCVVSYAQDNDGQMATDGSYLINGTYYYANGRMFDGKTTTTYECVNGVPQKITGARQSNTQPGQQQPSVPPVKSKYPVPAELGGAEGIKKFQDWLDKTHPGWHTKYNTLSQNVQF